MASRASPSTRIIRSNTFSGWRRAGPVGKDIIKKFTTVRHMHNHSPLSKALKSFIRLFERETRTTCLSAHTHTLHHPRAHYRDTFWAKWMPTKISLKCQNLPIHLRTNEMPCRITFLSAAKTEITAENMISLLIDYPNPFSQKSPQNEWATSGNIIKLTFWWRNFLTFGKDG